MRVRQDAWRNAMQRGTFCASLHGASAGCLFLCRTETLTPHGKQTENKIDDHFRILSGDRKLCLRAKGEAWIVWGLLTAGASLAFFSLFRNFGRFREWRNLRAEQEGEIVFSERALRVGQAVQIEDASNQGARYSATLCAVEKRTLRLRLERPVMEPGKEAPQRGAISTPCRDR